MRAVHKYPLLLASGPQVVAMPYGRVIHVNEQNGAPCMWTVVDIDSNLLARTFYVLATGEPLPVVPNMVLDYRGTVHVGWTVWHVFEADEPF